MPQHSSLETARAKTNERAKLPATESNALSPVQSGLTRGQQSVLNAQRTIGNQAVMRAMVQRDPLVMPEMTAFDDGNRAAGNSNSIGSDGNSVSAGPGGVSITSSGPLHISAPAVTVDAGMITDNTAMHKLGSVAQTDTIIAQNVVGSSYTPGAGNVW